MNKQLTTIVLSRYFVQISFILLIIGKRLRVYTLHNSKKAVTAD